MSEEKTLEQMTDLEFLDLYIEKTRSFINPILFREVQKRSLLPYVNYLPSDVNEAKAVMRGRMRKHRKYFGDPDTDKIAGEIRQMEALLSELYSMNMADAHQVIPILQRMMGHATYIKGYFSSTKPIG